MATADMTTTTIMTTTMTTADQRGAEGNTMSDPQALLRLLHLASPALPIGAFAYSQGLEAACNAGWVTDEGSAEGWILGLVTHGLATLDLPYFARLHAAFAAGDDDAAALLSERLFAARGSAELQAEDRRLGHALGRVLMTLGIPAAASWSDRPRVCHLTLFALAAAHWRLPVSDAAAAWLFAWCENQAAAAMRLVPLGQTSGLRILDRCRIEIPAAVAAALALPDDDLGWGCPGQALASAHHETQYSRIFRS
jgi:urease accessory protein